MLTEEELKKANDDAITVVLFIVFCFCVSACLGIAFRVFRLFAGL
jgi:hypothetical protein